VTATAEAHTEASVDITIAVAETVAVVPARAPPGTGGTGYSRQTGSSNNSYKFLHVDSLRRLFFRLDVTDYGESISVIRNIRKYYY
jgi:hypothetical protein